MEVIATTSTVLETRSGSTLRTACGSTERSQGVSQPLRPVDRAASHCPRPMLLDAGAIDLAVVARGVAEKARQTAAVGDSLMPANGRPEVIRISQAPNGGGGAEQIDEADREPLHHTAADQQQGAPPRDRAGEAQGDHEQTEIERGR